MNDIFILSKFLLKTISKKIIPSILSSFGSFWLIIQLGAFFLGDESVLINGIKELWYIFLIIGVLTAVGLTKPRLTFECKLINRDVSIAIAIGNLFKQKGSLIIGSNTTFDTHISNELISGMSTQGQFTKLVYYGNETKLDNEISSELKDIQPEILLGNRIGKDKKYSIGTTVKLNQQNKNYYLVAIANINEHGVASSTYDDFKYALACLWFFIGKKGLKENIAIPIIGSGFSRLLQKRELIIKEIIRSFIAACSEATFCDKLTIVISPGDIERYNINIEELEEFILYICKYTEFSNNSDKIGNQI